MARTQGHGNPNWTRDETILALDLYFQLGGNVPSPSDKRIAELSQLLRSMPYHQEAAKQPSFRNADGVGFKLMNLRQVATGKGLANVSKMDRDTWAEYGDRPQEVHRVAAVFAQAYPRCARMRLPLTWTNSAKAESSQRFICGVNVTLRCEYSYFESGAQKGLCVKCATCADLKCRSNSRRPYLKRIIYGHLPRPANV